ASLFVTNRRFALDGRAAELRRLLGRGREVVIFAAVIGVLTGLGVAAFDRITADAIFGWLTSMPVWVEALGPPVGLALAAAALHWLAGRAGPATAAASALEVPAPDDLASHALLPALVGAATSYAAFAAINGTAPLTPVGGRPPLDARDIIGAAAVGIACGGGARIFAWLLRGA